MGAYLFRSKSDPDVFAFTTDETGANLPQKYGPWQSPGQGQVISVGEAALTGEIRDALAGRGYYIARTKP
jgi:hypothetical protein